MFTDEGALRDQRWWTQTPIRSREPERGSLDRPRQEFLVALHLIEAVPPINASSPRMALLVPALASMPPTGGLRTSSGFSRAHEDQHPDRPERVNFLAD